MIDSDKSKLHSKLWPLVESDPIDWYSKLKYRFRYHLHRSGLCVHEPVGSRGFCDRVQCQQIRDAFGDDD